MIIQFTTIKFSICSAFVCAIEYGDLSGLTDNDIELLENFLKPFEGAKGHWSFDGNEFNFERCEITDLFADCCTATYVQRVS